MRFVNAGDWTQNALQLEMSTGEYEEWVRARSETIRELAYNEGSQSTAHYYLVLGRVRMIVYEIDNATGSSRGESGVAAARQAGHAFY